MTFTSISVLPSQSYKIDIALRLGYQVRDLSDYREFLKGKSIDCWIKILAICLSHNLIYDRCDVFGSIYLEVVAAYLLSCGFHLLVDYPVRIRITHWAFPPLLEPLVYYLRRGFNAYYNQL
jgi:hypothetical protein